jgi:nucleotide-binding universal stress UspA family protein
MLKHVLIPLDGSPVAEKALDMARRVLAPDGKVTLLTAIQRPEPPVYAYPSADVLDEIERETEMMANAHPEATSYLERMATNLKLNGVQNVEVELGDGDPADLIVDRAFKLGVEAIVMCTHGRSGLNRLLFGSVTQKVLNATPCPVLVVPNREQQRVEDEQPAGAIGLDTLAAE